MGLIMTNFTYQYNLLILYASSVCANKANHKSHSKQSARGVEVGGAKLP